MRTLSAIAYDVRFQLRHGFYYAYAFVSILYIVLLKLVPEAARDYAAIIVLLTDPSVLGYFFIGGIVLLEKDQSIFSSLFVTPLKVNEYITAKLVSLTLISLLSSAVIAYFATPGGFNPVLLLTAIALSSVFFTLAGLALAARVKSINGYMITSPFFLMPFVLPLFGFLKLFRHPVYYLLPGYGSLQLLSGAYNGISFSEALYPIVLLLVWDALAFIWAGSWFKKYVVKGIGGGSI